MKIKIPGLYQTNFDTREPMVRWFLIILGLFLIVAIISEIIIPFMHAQSFLTQINGDTASKKIIVGNAMGMESAISNTAKIVYEIAKKYPRVNRIVIHLYCGSDFEKGSGFHKETPIGDITITDLSDPRQSKNEDTYIEKTSGFYRERIKSIETANLIENNGTGK